MNVLQGLMSEEYPISELKLILDFKGNQKYFRP
jgi:hypothetical protein